MVMGEAKKDFTALLSGGEGHNVCPLWSYFSRRSTFFCPIHFMAQKQKLTLVSSPTYLLFSFPYIHFLIYDCWTFFDAARTLTLGYFFSDTDGQEQINQKTVTEMFHKL